MSLPIRFSKNSIITSRVYYDDAADAAAASAAAAAAASAASAAAKTYTEDEYKQGVEAEKNRSKEQNRVLVGQLEELKKNVSLTVEQKAALEKQIKDLNDTIFTKEELAKQALVAEQKKYSEEVGNITKDRDTWRNRYQTNLIRREMSEAASTEGAFDSGVFVSILGDKITTVEEVDPLTNEPTGEYKVVVKMEVEDKKEGKKVLNLAPLEAIKHMKNQPDKYGYLFKGVNVSGSGLDNKPENLGKIDLTKLSPDEYKKVRDQLMKS